MPSTRDRTLQEIRELGVDRVRVLVYWKDYAPAATSKRRPDFDAADPNAYPAGAWARLDGLFDSAQARGITVQLTLTGPVPRWATKGKRDNVTRPSTKEFQAFATAVGRRFGAQVGVWSIWNEPNHPQFLLPQFVKKKRQVAADLPQPLPRRPARPGRLGQRRRHAAVRRDRAARDPARRRAAGVPARGAVPRPQLPPARPLRARRGRRLRPPRLHDARRPALPPAGSRRRDDRRALAADAARSTAPARAGAIRRGLGVYLTEFGIQSTPDPFVGVTLARQAEYLAIAEHMAYVNPRVRSFSQYLLSDDKPRKGSRVERYGGFESGLRRSNGKAKPSLAAFRLPLAAEAYGRSDVLWGRVRPQPARTKVTILASRRKGRPFKPLRTVTTNHRGVFGLRAKHHDKQRYRVQWTAPDGKVWRGPPIRAT